VTDSNDTPEAAYLLFRSRRRDMSLLPQGSLALVNTQWFYGTVGFRESVWGIPGLWAARGADERGLELTATSQDGIAVDGSIIDGTAIVYAKDAPSPSAISFADGKTGSVIRGDDGKYALRVWDANSEDIKNFGSIDAYPYDPDWVITGTFAPIEGGRSLGVSHLKDEGAARDKMIPGEIRFILHGVEYRPAAFREGRALMIVFSDATSGQRTYSPTRMAALRWTSTGRSYLRVPLATTSIVRCHRQRTVFRLPCWPVRRMFSIPRASFFTETLLPGCRLNLGRPSALWAVCVVAASHREPIVSLFVGLLKV
jgi:uncharacterized protein (DUF1684 family)